MASKLFRFFFQICKCVCLYGNTIIVCIAFAYLSMIGAEGGADCVWLFRVIASLSLPGKQVACLWLFYMRA